jgi:hypothetical protein
MLNVWDDCKEKIVLIRSEHLHVSYEGLGFQIIDCKAVFGGGDVPESRFKPIESCASNGSVQNLSSDLASEADTPPAGQEMGNAGTRKGSSTAYVKSAADKARARENELGEIDTTTMSGKMMWIHAWTNSIGTSNDETSDTDAQPQQSGSQAPVALDKGRRKNGRDTKGGKSQSLNPRACLNLIQVYIYSLMFLMV